MQTLPCMNCGKSIPPGQSKIFAQVFLCETCSEIAKSFYEKLEIELKHLLTIAKESIRVALIQGKFQLNEQKMRDIPKKELLEEILRMEKLRDRK